MYKIKLHALAIKSLKKIPENNKILIKKKIDLLENFSFNMSNIKAMAGNYKGLFRLRVGNYRIVFDVHEQDKEIIVLYVFPRSKGY